MSLHKFREWAPFQIDALGIITLLGADEVDRAVGRLTRSHITDWLPFMGVYKIAGNSITEPIPGFKLYNITDGCSAMGITGWFSRWLLHQGIFDSTFTVHIEIRQTPASRTSLPAAIFGILALVPPVILSLLFRDWWGLVNAVAMAISVFVRRVVLEANEKAIDNNATEAWQYPTKAEEDVKLLLETPFGEHITALTTRRVLISCLLTTPRPRNPAYYRLTRALGWLAFAAQVVSLGMSCLFVQILTVFVVCLSTVLVTGQIGSDEQCVGKCLLLKKTREEGSPAYVGLVLNDTEKDSMISWGFFPKRSDSSWWDMHNTREAEKRRKAGAEHEAEVVKA